MKYLIDTTKKSKKQHSKRVIGLKEKKKRKLVFDFFKNAEDGVRLVLSDINGTYTMTIRIEYWKNTIHRKKMKSWH